MRVLPALILTLSLMLFAIACQGESGPAGEQGQLEEPPAPPKWQAEEYTKHLVQEAIDRYQSQGLDDTVAHYNTPESIDGQWYVFIFDENDTFLAHAANPALVGQPDSVAVGPNAYPVGEAVAASAEEAGAWFSYTYTNPASGAAEAKHSWIVDVGGLTFGSGWYESGPSKSDAPAYTKAFVQRAIDLYDAVGRERTIDYYNTPESMDGPWYTYIMGEDGTMLAHASHPPLLGLPASEVVGPNDYPSGAAVAAVADGGGQWFSYASAHPVTGVVDFKHSWVVKYDGLTFGSGWYEPGPSKSDASGYTKAFVERAIDLYHAVGLERTADYYNTAESIDGQWYVFIFDENDTFLAHAANPALVGQPDSVAVGPNNYPVGEAVAASAEEAGAWFSYTYTNPTSGAVEAKHSWIVDVGGLTFGSGWYENGPSKADAPAYTKAFVQRAIDLYNAVGLERTLDYYNTPESVDGQWYVFIIGADGYTIGHHEPESRGRDPALRVDPTGHFYGDDLLSATESGRWVDYVRVNPDTGEEQQKQKHSWVVRHDGLFFGSGWYE